MWTGYTPAIHRQSTSSPTSGNISPTSTYPPEVYQPRTPPPPRHNHRKSLSRVEETIMEDDLVARDYALSTRQVEVGGGGEGQGIETGTESDGGEGSSYRSVSPPRRVGSTSPDHEEAGGGEEFVPPKSIHDDYLSRYIQPIRPRPGSSKLDANTNIMTPGRPAPLRSTSTPAPNILTSPISLTSKPSVVPLRGLGFTPIDPDPTSGKEEGSRRGKPIFEIFNAELSQGSEGMVRALKGHLEEVLRVQEEIGRMHLELEGLGDGVGDERRGSEERRGSGMSGLGQGEGGEGSPSTPELRGKEGGKEEGGEGKENMQGKTETVLDKREKGVDELMDRLSTLSSNLRTYHELGTPKLSFSHSHSNSRPQSQSQSNPLNPQVPQMNRQHSAQADLLTFTTSPTPISPSPPRAEVGRSLPMRNPVAVHKGIDDLRRQEGLPSRRSTLNQSHTSRSPQAQEEGGYKKNSDLAPLRLSIDEEDGTIKKKQSASFWDLEGLKRGNGTHRWVEHEHGQGHEYDHDYGLAPDEFPSTGVGRSGSGRGKKFDSPIEMVDRTRPW